MKAFALRLCPNQDLRQSLQEFANLKAIQAGFILSAIGSLQQAKIRFANQTTSHQLIEKFEILSLNGTLSMYGMHLYIAIADSQGRTIGGHLDAGCLIYTTAEIVIGESDQLTFLRSHDPQTGCLELEIKELEIKAE